MIGVHLLGDVPQLAVEVGCSLGPTEPNRIIYRHAVPKNRSHRALHRPLRRLPYRGRHGRWHRHRSRCYRRRHHHHHHRHRLVIVMFLVVIVIVVVIALTIVIVSLPQRREAEARGRGRGRGRGKGSRDFLKPF